MKKLVSSNEAAQLLGLSLQGVHYRIKKGQLESIKQDGKIFVYVDSNLVKNQSTPSQATPKQTLQNDYHKLEDKILQSKDEQIHFLKKTIKFMKRQYTSEIDRLEKTQNKMLNVFQSEVDLLKSAFNEMKNIYKLDHQPSKEKAQTEAQKEPLSTTSRQTHDSDIKMEFMELKEFFILMRNYNKTDAQIKHMILDKVQSKDKRFIYNKDTKEVLIYKSDFLDLVSSY